MVRFFPTCIRHLLYVHISVIIQGQLANSSKDSRVFGGKAKVMCPDREQLTTSADHFCNLEW